jgi:peptide/nickel transport system permease protein
VSNSIDHSPVPAIEPAGSVAALPDATATGVFPAEVPSSSARLTVWRFFRDDKAAAVGMVVLGIIVLAAIFAPWIAPSDPKIVVIVDRQIPPAWASGGSWSHVLGTDALGRDVLSSLIYGARISLFVGIAVVLIAGSFGTLLGMLAGWRGGWVETVVMRIADAQIAFPGILFVVMVVAVIGPSLLVIVAVLAVFGWMVFARLMRGAVLQIRQNSYVVAAEMVGCSSRRIMFRHLLPNTFAPLLTQSMLELARVVLAEASLSYLGLGIQPPDTSWGLMVAENREYLKEAWWSVVAPGLALAVTVLSVNLVAASLRIRLDPTQQAGLRATRARKKRERAS